ncbi:MAG: DUF4115 domain-containing protein [Sphingomonadaceae bacterium]|uniref:helix-turn-helix domain-containing protein n=1 Tax=Thermaurantiacus sp. TaxID=2820283 RepID=UPI00298EF26C|nr:RodZ domain-containing protein [Thermaurantiacus sp.]MCS6987453.1 DUF4115 domain-containing protein [Sphingomonadaceae bacterium]MDW8415373.1 DUF4115 domain-containing protein [Thermaurantiacus sp.]
MIEGAGERAAPDAPGSADPVGESGGAEIIPLGRVAPTAASIGAELRRAREAVGLSLRDVAARTKIRMGLLEAIEVGEYDRLPALTYAVGFVKAYARIVGLDPQAAAARFRAESGREEPAPHVVDLQPLDERRLPSRGLVAASVGAAVLGVGLLVALGLRPTPPPPPEGPPTAPPPAAVPRAAAVVAPPAGLPAPTVVLAARDDVWIRVSDPAGGDRLFEGILRKGETFAVPPQPGLVLRAGRAGSVEVRIGDEVLPPLGGPAEVLRAQPLDVKSLKAAAERRSGLELPVPSPAG